MRAQVLVHSGERRGARGGVAHPAGPTTGGRCPRVPHGARTGARADGPHGEAIAELEDARPTVAEHAGPGSANNAALAWAYAVAGRTHDARARPRTTGIDRGTYLDQFTCALAGAFARVQADEPDAADAFDAAMAQIDATEARLDQAIVRVARAHGLAALGHPDAAAARRDADVRLAALELGMPGWERACRLAAGG